MDTKNLVKNVVNKPTKQGVKACGTSGCIVNNILKKDPFRYNK